MDKLIDIIKNLRQHQILAFLFLFLALISPGFVTINTFERSMLREVDTLKLILLSLSYTLPLFSISFATVVVSLDLKIESGSPSNVWYAASFVSSMLVFVAAAISLYVALFYGTDFFRTALCVSLAIPIVSYFIGKFFKRYITGQKSKRHTN